MQLSRYYAAKVSHILNLKKKKGEKIEIYNKTNYLSKEFDIRLLQDGIHLGCNIHCQHISNDPILNKCIPTPKKKKMLHSAHNLLFHN